MIEVSNLSKSFGHIHAVQNLSFSLQPGEVVGFLGPNGAGKSTTMKMLTGFLSPDSGQIKISGLTMPRHKLKVQQQIGYLPEGAPCYGEMTVLDFLLFIGKVRGYSGQELKQRVWQVLELLELESVLAQHIETLSKGYKRRVGLAQAIIHQPKVLILDEPTDGLDPNQKHQVRQLIRSLAKDRIIIVSTHILEEVSSLCNRVLLIASGQLVADASPQQLLQSSRYHQAVTIFPSQSLTPQQLSRLSATAGVTELEHNANGSLTLLAAPEAAIFPELNQLIASHNWPIAELTVEAGRLDEVFRRLTKGASQ